MISLLILVFWVVMLCGLVGRYQCFKGNNFLQTSDNLPTSSQGITIQEANTGIFNAMRTTKVAKMYLYEHPSTR
jgi:hypothetical protein